MLLRTLLLFLIFGTAVSCKKDRLPCEEDSSGIICIENDTSNDIDITLNRVNVTQVGQSYAVGILTPSETKCANIFIGEIIVNGFNNQLESWGDTMTVDECTTKNHTLL